MYDIAIVGAGPAGLSAAITARARGKKVLVLSNDPADSPLARSSNIDNYPGITRISGKELLEKMVSHAQPGVWIQLSCYPTAWKKVFYNTGKRCN